jgi:hypothetical protein
MSNSRREFLTQSTLTLLGAAATSSTLAQTPTTPATPGAPPAFGTAPAVGPVVTPNTFAEAEKLLQFPLTEKDQAQAAGNWRSAMAPLYERRVGPRKVAISETTAPYSRWDCTLHGMNPGPSQNRFSPSTGVVPPMPSTEEAIAYSPVHHLSLDPDPAAQKHPPRPHLSRTHRAVQPQAQLHHHPHPRPRPRTSQSRRRRNRRRPLPRPTPRHPLGREGSPRHRQHPHHLRRRTLSQPNPHHRRHRHRPP